MKNMWLYIMTPMYSNVYNACILSGLVSFLVATFTISKTAVGAYLAGYSVLAIATLLILLMIFADVINKQKTTESLPTFIIELFSASGPFIIMLGVILFLIYLLVRYMSAIVDGHVSSSYSAFNHILVVLMMIQYYIIYVNFNVQQGQGQGGQSQSRAFGKVINSIMYLLCVVSVICAAVIYTVLKYYSTDGFLTLG